MVKLGILHPTGRLDDLGTLNGGSTPGADSERLADEYGWDTHYEDDGAFYAGSQVENTGELTYVFGIEVTDLSGCGETRSVFTSEMIEGGLKRFESRDDLNDALRELPNLEALINEWAGEEIDHVNDVESFVGWCDWNTDEVDESLMHTGLVVVPVNLPGKKVREVSGSAEHFETFSLPQFQEHGDWRSDVWSIATYGIKAHVESTQSWVADGEYPTEDIKAMKQVALQARMLFGFFMDRPQNAIGETGWDWMRNAGIIFQGDEVMCEGLEGRWRMIDRVSGKEKMERGTTETPDGKLYAIVDGALVWEDEDDFPEFNDTYTLEDVEGEADDTELGVSKVQALDFRERLLRNAKDKAASSEEG